MLVQAELDKLPPLGFPEATEDTKQHAPHHDTGDRNNAHRQSEWLQVRKQFVSTAILTKFLAVVKQFHPPKVRAPFIIKWTVPSAAVNHPEAAAIDLNTMIDGHRTTPGSGRSGEADSPLKSRTGDHIV